MTDLIIIGAGPAGLTAALYARRASKSVLVLEKETFGGQITHSPKVENYPGFLEMSGNEFADKLLDQVFAQGAEVELAAVLGVVKEGETFRVTTDNGDYAARAVIIASGAHHRPLGVPGEENFVGKGIHYCAVCDGAFYAGRSVAVIGGGNTALQEAVLLADRCAHVTLVQNLDFFTGEEALLAKLRTLPNVSFLTGRVVDGFLGEETLAGIRIKDGAGKKEDLSVAGVFVAIGQIPQNEPFREILPLDERGYLMVGESCETEVPGLFVAGDCRQKTVRQITTATGDGATAAVAACRYLDK